jgi:hypothetical protein
MFAGTLENCGPPSSPTVTVKLPLAEFAPSLALQFTVVDPIGNVEPDAGLQETDTEPATASVALTEYVTTVPEAEVAETLIPDGRLRLGAVVSCTLTVNVDGADVLFDASVAVQLTVVFPSGNSEPEPGLQVTVGLGSVSSVAVAENVTAAPEELVASAVTPDGTVSTGGVVSGVGGGGGAT